MLASEYVKTAHLVFYETFPYVTLEVSRPAVRLSEQLRTLMTSLSVLPTQQLPNGDLLMRVQNNMDPWDFALASSYTPTRCYHACSLARNIHATSS